MLQKKFIEQVLALSNRGEKLAASVQSLSVEALKSAYSNTDNAKAQFLLDNIPQYMRVAVARWFRRMGVEVIAPAVGQKNYIVQGVRDSKYQAKAFERAPNVPVFDTEVVEKAEPKKKDKVLKGTPETRAVEYMAKLIERISKDDYAAAALINDKWATSHYKSVLFTAEGKEIYLDAEELELITNLLIKREMAIRQAA